MNQKRILFPEQGDIYLADLRPVQGHEQGGLRPVVILQNNTLNRHLSTLVVAPFTTNLQSKGLMTTFFLSARKGHLPKDSVALLCQVRTIDKIRLIKYIEHLGKEDFLELRIQLLRIFY